MSTVHDIARIVRRIPFARRALTAGDPRRRAERLLASGIIDAGFYHAQYPDVPEDAAAAAAHYVRIGYIESATLSPFIDPDVLDANLMISGRPIIYDYVNSRAWDQSTSLWWRSDLYLAAHPEAADHPGGPVGHLQQALTAGDVSGLTLDGTPIEADDWPRLRSLLATASCEWIRQRQDRAARIPDEEPAHPPVLPDRFPNDAARPLVSIIMPVLNRPLGVRTAIQSLRQQTWQEWELVVVDDGSWDDTAAVVEAARAHDARVRLIVGAHAGVSSARNTGIAAARGSFIAFLDSDNTWRPRFLEDMMTAMARSRSGAAYATLASHTGDDTVYRQRQTDHRRLLSGNTIDLNTLIVRADVLREVGLFDVTLRRAVDYDLILRIAKDHALEHVPTVGADYENDHNTDRISTSEAVGWNVAVRLRHLAIEHPAEVTNRFGVSYLIARRGRDPEYVETLGAATELADDHDSETLFVAMEPTASEWRLTRLRAEGRRIQPLLAGNETLSYVTDAYTPLACGEVLVVVGPDVVLDQTWARELARRGATGAAAPVGIRSDGTLTGIGAAFPRRGAIPIRILAQHPIEDLRRLPAQLEVPLLTGSVFAVRADLLAGVGGLDPLLHGAYEAEGMSQRLRDAHPGLALTVHIDLPVRCHESNSSPRDLAGSQQTLRGYAVENHSSQIDTLYGAAGFEAVRIAAAPESGVDEEGDALPEDPYLRAVVRRRGGPATRHRLRWALQTASPAGPKGETWGDTHFARSLAAALESLGQEVVVDAREATGRPSSYLDDVVVVLRGLDEITPDPATLSYLWVISHPDLLSRREASRYDRVFAASVSWSAEYAQRWRLPIEPLLQCTDPTRFTWAGGQRSTDILFVGNSRGVPRAVVMESVRSGARPKIYGGGWEQFLPPDAVTSPGVDNSLLGEMYGNASIVLNDHWADMQRENFISNRLFDAVAAGGRVLSDDVAGVADLFQGAVRTYRSVSEIGPLLADDHDALFPPEDELRRISADVRRDHSFEARARVLVDHALRDLGITE